MKKLLLLISILILMSFKYKGIDVSRYQGKIAWNKIDTTISFAIIKATEGTSLKDKCFDYNWNNVKNTHIYRGAYHFFTPNKSGIEQAKFFLNIVKFKKGDIIPVIDVEKMMWKTVLIKNKRGKIVKRRLPITKDANLNLKQMINYIYITLHVKPIIYTSTHFWKSYFADNFVNEHHHILWIADYRKHVKNPKIPSDWDRWTIWQYSPKYKLYGVPKYVDINVSKLHPSYFLIK